MRARYLIALFLASACSGDDGGGGGGNWQLLGEHRPSSLLAVWASDPHNVWAVGGREGVGKAPTVLHYDGQAWTTLDPGITNVDLWSVFGFDDGTVYMGGSNGTILRYRAGAFEKLTTPSADITFGLWGSTPDDVWAVGGQLAARGFAWHLVGGTFQPATVPDELAMGTVWKVTGRSATDVWMSCSKGLVLHWDGSQLTNERVGAAEDLLFGIGCSSKSCTTAGSNQTNGVLFQNDGGAWASKVPTQDGPVWRGMTPTGEHPFVVGMFGAVLRYDGTSWVSDPSRVTTSNLHAAWSDGDGNLFAVGGEFDRFPTVEGVLLFKGREDLPLLP